MKLEFEVQFSLRNTQYVLLKGLNTHTYMYFVFLTEKRDQTRLLSEHVRIKQKLLTAIYEIIKKGKIYV